MMQSTDFRDRPLLFVDLEMTGLDPTVHEIIEIGALVVDGRTLEVKQEYEAKVVPEHIETADPEALKINGYKAQDWKQAQPLEQVITTLNTIAPGAMVVGWNMAVDWSFLEQAHKKTEVKRSFDYHTIDVLPMAWAYAQNHPEIKEIKLSEFCKHFEIQREAKHRAMADIKATYELFRKLLAK